MAINELELINIQSRRPTVAVLHPTAFTARSESEVPIRNNTRIIPRRANAEISGEQLATTGKQLRVNDASKKSPMNHGTEILVLFLAGMPHCGVMASGAAMFFPQAKASPSVNGTIQSVRDSFTAVAVFKATVP